MTTACLIFLGISLLLYLAASLLFQGDFLFGKTRWHRLGFNALLVGLAVNGVGLLLHFLISGQSPFSNLLTLIALLVMAFLAAGLLIEHWVGTKHLGLLLAPLAFLGLLYPVLMPVRFDDVEHILLRFPWLGIHVAITLIGHVGFALAFCTAVAHLIQARLLKRGRLNHYLPPLDTAAAVTFYSAGVGFSFFTIGLGMGIVWLFGAPGEYLGPRDTKIWLALPTWTVYAVYLYLRGVRGQHGSRLMWLAIAGFALAVLNLVGVRHGFDSSLHVGAVSGLDDPRALRFATSAPSACLPVSPWSLPASSTRLPVVSSRQPGSASLRSATVPRPHSS